MALSSKRTPSLGDIEPEQHEKFIARQKEFRANLAEAQKQREASAFASSSSPNSSSSPAAAGGLGSLSTALGGKTGASANTTDQEPPRKAGPLTNLIYGTKEGREMDAQIEASFSQVLARGKYVHSIVFHEVKPKHVDEYVELVGNWYPKIAASPENKVHLVGSWRTEVGDCDTFGKLDSRAIPCFCYEQALINLLHPGLSPYLGISTVPGLPRIVEQHLEAPRIPCLREEA